MKKIRNILLVVFFTGLISYFGIYTIMKEPVIISLTENREMASFKAPTIESLEDTSFQKNTDNAFADQILFRDEFMKIYQRLNNVLTKFVYLFVDDDRMTLYPISDNGVFKVGANGEYLVEFPYLQSQEYSRQLMVRISNYNDIQSNHPELNMYLYKVTNARDKAWFNEANYIESSGDYYRQWLVDNLDSRITYFETQYDNWEDYQEKNYRTDHHWNVYGAYQGYSDLIQMMVKDFPQIGQAKEPKDSYCSTAKFYGSLVKRSNYNLDENIYDTICEFEYDLPTYSVFVNDQSVEEYGQRSKYKNNQYDLEKGTNHYREFFGVDSAKVVYDFGNNTGVNAIIISDSYTNAIKPVLASHFDKTVYIDMRYYLGEYGEFFNLKKCVEENNIDLVLYVGSLSVIYMDESYNISLY